MRVWRVLDQVDLAALAVSPVRFEVSYRPVGVSLELSHSAGGGGNLSWSDFPASRKVLVCFLQGNRSKNHLQKNMQRICFWSVVKATKKPSAGAFQEGGGRKIAWNKQQQGEILPVPLLIWTPPTFLVCAVQGSWFFLCVSPSEKLPTQGEKLCRSSNKPLHNKTKQSKR